MLVHTADYLREHGQHASSARYFAQEMNWGNAAMGRINSVLHGLEADIRAGASTITDPQFLENGRVKRFSLVLANFPFSDEFWWLKPEQQTDDKKKKDKLKNEVFGKEGFKAPRSNARSAASGFHSRALEVAPLFGALHGRWPHFEIPGDRSERGIGQQVQTPFATLIGSESFIRGNQPVASRRVGGPLDMTEQSKDHCAKSHNTDQR
jgi:hypothetical protein